MYLQIQNNVFDAIYILFKTLSESKHELTGFGLAELIVKID